MAPLRRRLWFLLAGFFVGGAAVGAALVALGIGSIRLAVAAELPLALGAGWLLVTLGAVWLIALRPAPENRPDDDVQLVEEASERRLVRTVEKVAAQVGVRIPVEIVFSPGAGISCLETGRLLGKGRRCRVEIGLAAIQALDVPRFEAVLALHLAHQADGDLLARRVLDRTFRTIDRTIESSSSIWAGLFRRYRNRLAAAWEDYERAHVHVVDEAAVRVAGVATYRPALRRVAILPSLFERYLAEEVQPILDEGFVPADLYGGFRLCLEALEESRQLDRIEDEEAADEEDGDGGFPSVAKRLERLQRLSLPHPLPSMEAGLPARELLMDADAAESRAAPRWAGETKPDARQLRWSEVAERVWAARFRSAAAALRGALPASADLGFVIDWLAGRSQVALAAAAWPRLLESRLDDEQRQRRARQLVHRGVAGWIGEELASQGWRWDTAPGWAVELESPDGERIAPLALLAPLGSEEGAAAAVRARLQELGVDVGDRAAAAPTRHRARSYLH